jgi:hypothetical protein
LKKKIKKKNSNPKRLQLAPYTPFRWGHPNNIVHLFSVSCCIWSTYKSCVHAFGADQFDIKHQCAGLEGPFSIGAYQFEEYSIPIYIIFVVVFKWRIK